MDYLWIVLWPSCLWVKVEQHSCSHSEGLFHIVVHRAELKLVTGSSFENSECRALPRRRVRQQFSDRELRHPAVPDRRPGPSADLQCYHPAIASDGPVATLTCSTPRPDHYSAYRSCVVKQIFSLHPNPLFRCRLFHVKQKSASRSEALYRPPGGRSLALPVVLLLEP